MASQQASKVEHRVEKKSASSGQTHSENKTSTSPPPENLMAYRQKAQQSSRQSLGAAGERYNKAMEAAMYVAEKGVQAKDVAGAKGQ